MHDSDESGQLDIFMGVDFNYRDIFHNQLFELLVNLTPGVKWDMGEGWQASAQALLPVYNEYGDRYKNVRLNEQPQNIDSKKQKRLAKTEDSRINVKVNSLLLIAIVNPAVEFKVLPKVTTQLEAFGSFYTTDFLGTGKPFVLGSASLEFRYYPRAAFNGFFAAPNIGFGVYKLNKGIVPGYKGDYKPEHEGYPYPYQQGSNVMVGATIGYQWNIDKHWSIEVAWGGGFHQSVYQGYKWNPDLVSKDYHGNEIQGAYQEYVGRNASSEWLPIYKGGIFIGYRF